MSSLTASPFRSCKRFGLPFYRCPSAASLILGTVSVILILLTHQFTSRMRDIDLGLVIDIGVAAALLLVLFLVSGRLQRDVERREEADQLQRDIESVRNEFTNIASQDIAEASTAIKWGIRTLEPSFERLDKPEQQTLMHIRDRNDHILDVVRNLVLLARVERKEIIVTPAHADLGAIIGNLLSITARRTKAHGTQVVYIPPPAPIFATTDHIVLADILQSLYSFALERTRGESDAISIRVFTIDTGSAQVPRIVIADNAPPVAQHMRKDIFARVVRNPTTGEMSASSLGPHVAHELARILGADLSATTTDEQTSFAITFAPIATK